MGVCVMKKDYLDYEIMVGDLKALSVLVEALNSDTVITMQNKDLRDNCFSLVSEMIYGKACIAQELFNDYHELQKGIK